MTVSLLIALFVVQALVFLCGFAMGLLVSALVDGKTEENNG